MPRCLLLGLEPQLAPSSPWLPLVARLGSEALLWCSVVAGSAASVSARAGAAGGNRRRESRPLSWHYGCTCDCLVLLVVEQSSHVRGRLTQLEWDVTLPHTQGRHLVDSLKAEVLVYGKAHQMG